MPNDFLAVLGVVLAVLGLLPAAYQIVKHRIHSSDVIANSSIYYVLAINLLFTIALPMALVFEFDAASSGEAYKAIDFYCKYYPHIVVYPALLFGFAGLFTLRAAILRWTLARRPVIFRLLIAAIGAFFALYYEATGGYMMLFEFNKEAQSATAQFRAPEVQQNLLELGLKDAFTTPMASQISTALAESKGQSKIAKALTSYEPWAKLGSDWRSKSRIAYLVMFWYMIFVMLFGFSMLPTNRAKNVRNKHQDSLISLNLAAALAVFLMWTPFRLYYNHHTKFPIFGREIVDNFFGPLPNMSILGLTASEAAPLVTILVFIYFLLLRAADLTKRVSIVVISLCGASLIVGFAYIAVLDANAFRLIFGLQGDLKFLLFRVVVVFLIVLLTYDYLSSRVDDLSENPSLSEDSKRGA